jgi:hypothetical protein
LPDRSELVRANVLSEIADDYEEIDQIMIQLERWSAELKISRVEVTIALADLLAADWARAYDLRISQAPLDPAPKVSQFDDLYFYITPKGAEILKALPYELFPKWTDD